MSDRRGRSVRRAVGATVAVLAIALPLGTWGVLVDEPDDAAEEVVASDGELRLEGTGSEEVLAADLRALAAIWADFGGRWGYPWWERSWRSWQDGALDPGSAREHVVGYAALLEPGCAELDGAEPAAPVAERVRELLAAACSTRLRALRGQAELLDGIVEDGVQPAADEDAAELAASVEVDLQDSWRDARLAMELAQAQLEALGEPRLPEDAII